MKKIAADRNYRLMKRATSALIMSIEGNVTIRGVDGQERAAVPDAVLEQGETLMVGPGAKAKVIKLGINRIKHLEGGQSGTTFRPSDKVS